MPESKPLTDEELAAIETLDIPDVLAARLARKLAREESFDDFDVEVAAKILLPFVEARVATDRRLVAEVRRLRRCDWIDLAAAEIAGDPGIRDGGADRIADVIRGHIEAATKKRGA